MKVFPDANVLVASLLWGDGVCAKIMDSLLLEEAHEIVIGAWVWEETRRTLGQRFQVPLDVVDEYESVVLGGEHTVWQRTPLALSPYLVADPDDRVVLSCALTAAADFLITGDKALLAVSDQVRRTDGLLIMAPGRFWERRGELW
ncbi:putative toxin-antitoxin system toxin component, PIN family [Rhodothermus sp. AH-315-K08]|nr:putative toxin-antitoxin system toxin component, PIN family [Rhodothermus sp. AH-315-K08]